MDQLILEYTINELSILDDIKEDVYYAESKVYDVLDDILSFFQKIINDVIAFGRKVKNDIDSLIQKNQVKMKLKRLKKELQQKQEEGVRKVSMIDVEEFISYYSSYKGKLMRKLNVLSRGNFKKKEKIEKIIEDIEIDLEDMNEVLSEVMEHRKTISIKKAISYVEDNLTGRSKVEKEFVEITHQLKEIAINIERVVKNTDLTSDAKIRSDYVGPIKRITKKITGTTGKWFQKFVMSVVFFFA